MILLNDVDTKNGYYLYNGKPYYDRKDAFDDMLKNEDYDGVLQFYFNDDAYEKVNWFEPIHNSLSDLYKIRALNLRQKYDYLILSFSGGSDSTQMLMTFLKNKIFVDEIQIYHHEKAISKLDRNIMLQDYELKQFLEYEYSALPMLKVVKQLSPNTKITSLDMSDYIHDQIMSQKLENIGLNDKNITSISAVVSKIPRFTTFYAIKHNEKTINRTNVGFIRGLEKPTLRLTEHNRLYHRFFDVSYHGIQAFNKGALDKFMSIENFYWTPDLPHITLKQVQVIRHELETNKGFYQEFLKIQKQIDSFHKKNVIGHSPAFMLERMYNKLIYPDWNLNTFVAGKPRVINPEYKLATIAMGEHKAQDVLNEYRDYKLKKYDKIKNKGQLLNFIFTKDKDLGVLKIKW